MTSTNTLCNKLLDVKNTVMESASFYIDDDRITHLRIQARPNV